MRILLLALLWGIAVPAWSEISSWHQVSSSELIAEEDGVAAGQKVTLGFDVHTKEGWHTYWVNPGDSGSTVKLSLSAKSGANSFDLLTGPILFPVPERFDSGPITSFVYGSEVMFLADVVIPDTAKVGDSLHFKLDSEWLVCKDVCIPAFDTLELTLPVRKPGDVQPSSLAEKFLAWRGRLPHLETTIVTDHRDGQSATLTFPIPPDFAGYRYQDFFPLRGSFLANTKAQAVKESDRELTLQTEVRDVGDRVKGLIGLVLLKKGDKTVALQWGDPNYGFVSKEKPAATEPAPPASVLWMLVSAFLGGLILNLMPCVFPVLSIKLLSIMQQSEKHPSEVRIQNFAYVAGVILSFLAIGGSLALLRQTGELIGWGFQLQSPVFVLLLSWLFFLLALQMLGWFELDLINPNMGGNLARQSGWVGSFFTGVLAVVVASPCTAPFMGAALGLAFSQSAYLLLVIFLTLGIGLAFPYMLFGLFPSWGKALPRPGAWMQRLKEFFAFPLFLTSIWMLWLLAQLRGDFEIMVALIGFVGLAFAIWLRHRILTAVVALTIVIVGAAIVYSSPEGRAVPTSGGLWTPFSPAAIQRASDETVFVDFTADWCLTCKVNERLVLGKAEIMSYLQEHHVRLVKGDWTRQDAEITKFLNNYHRAGVPFYIAFGPGAPEGKIFPELLTSDIFRSQMEEVLQIPGGSK